MSLHPVGTAIVIEHNRRSAFAQATLLALCLLALAITPAAADDSGTAAVNLLPTSGKHRGIVLKSQTVDAVILEEQGKVWADTKVWMKLQNPASKPITVSVSLPGPQMAPVPLPADLSVQVGKVPLQLVPSTAADSSQPTGATAAIRIPARKSVDVRIAYRQALSDTNGVVTYGYLLDEAAKWAGTPESLRLTVTLKPSVSMRSLLAITPPAHRSDGQTMTWDWETDWGKLGANVGFAFMSPGWFAEFEAAQSAAANEDAGAADHLLLSRHYSRLASLQGSLLNAPFAFQSRYYPAAIAELQAALDSEGPTSEQAEAHSIMAKLYVEQAEQGNEPRYLQAAAAEIRSALGDSEPDPDLVELAGRVFEELSGIANAAGEGVAARHYVEQFEEIRAFSPQQAALSQATSQRLDQVALALEQGNRGTARDLVASLVATQASDVPEASPPIVNQTSLMITTTPQGRQIVTHLGDDANLQEALELAAETERALRPHSPAKSVGAANSITLTLPGPPGPAMFVLQKELAEAVPDAPELALLHSVLADTSGYTETHTSLLRSTWQFTETVDLAPALRRWEGLAARLDAATPALPLGLSTTESERLRFMQRSLRASDAAAWRRFAASSTVDYRFEPTDPDTNYQWQVRAGESRQMFVQMAQWNSRSIHWAIVALSAAVAAIALLMWRLA
jgi:hypothetical protein